ncbi:hypothetical protein NKG05_00265 [Oerskovia sp. M15]
MTTEATSAASRSAWTAARPETPSPATRTRAWSHGTVRACADEEEAEPSRTS